MQIRLLYLFKFLDKSDFRVKLFHTQHSLVNINFLALLTQNTFDSNQNHLSPFGSSWIRLVVKLKNSLITPTYLLEDQ